MGDTPCTAPAAVASETLTQLRTAEAELLAASELTADLWRRAYGPESAEAGIDGRALLRIEHEDAKAAEAALKDRVKSIRREAGIAARTERQRAIAAADPRAAAATRAVEDGVRELERMLHTWARETFEPRRQALRSAHERARLEHDRALADAGEPAEGREPYALPSPFPAGATGRSHTALFRALASSLAEYVDRTGASPRAPAPGANTDDASATSPSVPAAAPARPACSTTTITIT